MGRPLGAMATPAAEMMRMEFVRGMKLEGGEVMLDTASLPGPDGGWDDSIQEVHLTYRKKNGEVHVEKIDARLFALQWAESIHYDSAPPARAVVGIVAHPTSCRCGGDMAWLARTTLYGAPAGDIMLGCCCHTDATRLIQALRTHVWGEPDQETTTP